MCTNHQVMTGTLPSIALSNFLCMVCKETKCENFHASAKISMFHAIFLMDSAIDELVPNGWVFTPINNILTLRQCSVGD